MFVGAYWSKRMESRAQAAARIEQFLSTIASKKESLSKWFLKGRSRAHAKTEFPIDTSSIDRALAANRRDVGGEPMPEVGFSFGIWNGADVSLAATLGAFSPYVQNSVVLSFGHEADELSDTDWRDLLGAAVLAFDP